MKERKEGRKEEKETTTLRSRRWHYLRSDGIDGKRKKVRKPRLITSSVDTYAFFGASRIAGASPCSIGRKFYFYIVVMARHVPVTLGADASAEAALRV